MPVKCLVTERRYLEQAMPSLTVIDSPSSVAQQRRAALKKFFCMFLISQVPENRGGLRSLNATTASLKSLLASNRV
jgi:hypothetical protein